MPEAVQKMLRLRAPVKAVVREEARVDAGSEPVLRRREFDLWPLVQGLVGGDEGQAVLMHKRRKKLLLASLLLIPGAFLLGAALVVAGGLRDDIRPADVAIVPGNTVESDGRPSARLRARLDKAAELYRGGLFRHVIVSGGTGVEGFNEAEVMKSYLISRGVPEAHIIADGEGLTTSLTARNAARVMKERGWQSALVISQYFHVPRTRLAVESYGVRPVYSAHADYFELRDVYSVAREVIGYGAYLMRRYDVVRGPR